MLPQNFRVVGQAHVALKSKNWMCVYIPARNAAHVTCMLHATSLIKHACNMHVVLHATCMLQHACYMSVR